MSNRFFEAHYPHRVNLLVTFRERFGPNANHPLNPETCRDFYRCAKDIAMAMVRYFCEELGVKNPDVNSNKLNFTPLRQPPVSIHHLTEQEFNSSPRASAVHKVLFAANKAVAHTNIAFIDQVPDDNVLTDAINQTEDWVRERIFQFNGVFLDDMMALESNCMYREREIKRV